MNDLLVVYYSRSGTARQVAETLAHRGQGHIGEIRDAHPRLGLWGDVRCVVDELFDRLPAIRYTGPSPSRFGTIVLVAPVWMRRLACPMRTFLREHPLKPDRLGCIFVMAREGGFNAMQAMADLTQTPVQASLVLRQQQVLTGGADADLERFLEAILAPGEPAQRPVELCPHVA